MSRFTITRVKNDGVIRTSSQSNVIIDNIPITITIEDSVESLPHMMTLSSEIIHPVTFEELPKSISADEALNKPPRLSTEELSSIFSRDSFTQETNTFIDEFDYLVNAISEFIGINNKTIDESLSTFNPYISTLSSCCKYVNNTIIITDQESFDCCFKDIIGYITEHELAATTLNIANEQLSDIISLVGVDIVKRKVLSKNIPYPMFPISVNYVLILIDPTLLIHFNPHDLLTIRDFDVIEILRKALSN